MDTKSKSSKGFKIWLYAFIGANIILLFLGSAMDRRDGSIYYYNFSLRADYKDSQAFKDNIGYKFNFLARYLTHEWIQDGEDAIEYDEYKEGLDEEFVHEPVEENTEDLIDRQAENRALDIEKRERYYERKSFEENAMEEINSLDGEGKNLIYYAKNPKTGLLLTNSDTDLGAEAGGALTLPPGYNFYIFYNGEKFIGERDGKPLSLRENGYMGTQLGYYLGGFRGDRDSRSEIRDIRGCHIFLAVKDNIVKNPYDQSFLYEQKRDLDKLRYTYIGFIMVLAVVLGLFVYASKNKEYRREVDQWVGHILCKVFLEIKILVSFMVLVRLQSLIDWYYVSNPLRVILFIPVLLWWAYFVWIDIRYNRHDILPNNAISKVVGWYRGRGEKRPFQKAQLFRFYSLVVVEIILAAAAVIFIIIGFSSYYGGAFIISGLVLGSIGVFLIFWYARRFNYNLQDIGRVIDHTALLRQGDTATRLQLSSKTDLYALEDNLNAIQEGVAQAVENSIKSERMKVELITNISHDLKTPLTSIISYVDLLSKEEGLPEHVKDYIKILGQKSERLKFLIQDLFDLSKAVSGEMEFERKTIDLGRLIEQTLGDIEDKIKESHLVFRVSLPHSPVLIKSDGTKLYRVFLNLFQNTLKYSLVGTRVYVDLVTHDGKAIVTIKNTANYEMNFKEEEIIERFVRGDEARASEGSGLGLAIAQNFTKACGGEFDIKVDGDQFKAILAFDLESKEGL